MNRQLLPYSWNQRYSIFACFDLLNPTPVNKASEKIPVNKNITQQLLSSTTRHTTVLLCLFTVISSSKWIFTFLVIFWLFYATRQFISYLLNLSLKMTTLHQSEAPFVDKQVFQNSGVCRQVFLTSPFPTPSSDFVLSPQLLHGQNV